MKKGGVSAEEFGSYLQSGKTFPDYYYYYYYYVRGKKEIKGKKARKYAEEQHDNNKSYRRKIFRIESNTSELGKN